MAAGWFTVSEQVHWPPVSVQTAALKPPAWKRPPTRSHATGTEETVRQSVESGSVAEPVVVVSSV